MTYRATHETMPHMAERVAFGGSSAWHNAGVVAVRDGAGRGMPRWAVVRSATPVPESRHPLLVHPAGTDEPVYYEVAEAAVPADWEVAGSVARPSIERPQRVTTLRSRVVDALATALGAVVALLPVLGWTLGAWLEG